MASHLSDQLNRHECFTLDVTMHDKGRTCPDGDWAQAKYLVHGWDDTLWTDDIDEAMTYLKESLLQAEASRG